MLLKLVLRTMFRLVLGLECKQLIKLAVMVGSSLHSGLCTDLHSVPRWLSPELPLLAATLCGVNPMEILPDLDHEVMRESCSRTQYCRLLKLQNMQSTTAIMLENIMMFTD